MIINLNVKRLIIISLFTLSAFFLSLSFCYGQEMNASIVSYKAEESYLKLSDSVIKSEIAFFNIKATICQYKFPKIKVNEIVLKSCTDSSVYFEKGNIYANEIEVAILSTNQTLKPRITGIYYFRYKYVFWFPNSAINDIFYPKFCHENSRRNKPILSDCKVFQSEDKRRIYIYMLNGEGENQYEITWVIQDDEYYSRVIDVI